VFGEVEGGDVEAFGSERFGEVAVGVRAKTLVGKELEGVL